MLGRGVKNTSRWRGTGEKSKDDHCALKYRGGGKKKRGKQQGTKKEGLQDFMAGGSQRLAPGLKTGNEKGKGEKTGKKKEEVL